jgi:multiple RNA-binding domain-containing protein 1
MFYCCRAAFKALAYKKYQHVPLYLEWAPRDIWEAPAGLTATAPSSKLPSQALSGSPGHAEESEQQQQLPQQSKAAAAAAAAAAGEDEADGDAPVACIYVKNLNFNTSDAGLRKHFDKALSAAGGLVHSAKVGSAPVAAAITSAPSSCCPPLPSDSLTLSCLPD